MLNTNQDFQKLSEIMEEEIVEKDSGNGHLAEEVIDELNPDQKIEPVREIPDYFKGNPVLENAYADYRRGKIKLRYFARQTGYSRPTLGLVFNGKYNGRVPDVVSKIERAAKEFYDRGELVKIKSYTEIRKTCELAWANFDINAVIGPAGIGKSEALKSYWQENLDHCIYIPIWDFDTPREVIDKIAHELDIKFGSESLSKRMRRICDTLKIKPRLIILDEADQARIAILNAVRQIWDEGDCGLIIAGNTKLKVLLTRGENMLSNLSYLYRRITITLRLDSTSYTDAQALLGKYVDVTISESCVKQIIKLVKENGEIDRFCKIIDAAKDQAEYNKIADVTDEVILKAASTMVWG